MQITHMTDAQLLKEYKELRKAGFNQMFGMNAKRELNEVVDVLASRGITMEPNIFGDMPIKKWEL